MHFLILARLRALRHVRFFFPKPRCRVWRLYSCAGLKTHAVFCECGVVFGADERGDEMLKTPIASA